MRRRLGITAVLVTLSVGMLAPPPAIAAWESAFAGIGYLDRYTADGQISNLKAAWVLDRTGDDDQRYALKSAVDTWNANLSSAGLLGTLPWLIYQRDDAWIGQCSSGWDGVGPTVINQTPGHEYSFILACSGAPTGKIGISRGGPSYSRHFRQARVFPYVFCADPQTPPPPYAPMNGTQLKSCWGHELGHAMGYPHNNTYGHIMERLASGIYAGSWFTTADIQALDNLYPAATVD